MKIPSIIWLMLGIFLTLASWYLGDDFALFFYAGLIIISLGLFKTIIQFVLSSKATTKIAPRYKEYEHQHYAKCRHCGNTIRRIDYFCSMCGKRVR